MRRPVCTLLVALFLILPAAASGQERAHVVPPEALDALAVEHAAATEADRAELRAFLERPEVRDVAAEAGIDILTAASAVSTLGDDDVRRLSGQLAQVDAALAGGDTVVISTTAIIIGLLIVIILLVA